ncbi:hypothetical protein FDUTEX481_07593 [Tolypothrix sp. PCC 7601]|nr:hypothetical protein FDUTEX481_07593 [Tolypothrix sp. PCC 7601]
MVKGQGSKVIYLQSPLPLIPTPCGRGGPEFPSPQSPVPSPQSPVPITPYPQRGPRVPHSPFPSPHSQNAISLSP